MRVHAGCPPSLAVCCALALALHLLGLIELAGLQRPAAAQAAVPATPTAILTRRLGEPGAASAARQTDLPARVPAQGPDELPAEQRAVTQDDLVQDGPPPQDRVTLPTPTTPVSTAWVGDTLSMVMPDRDPEANRNADSPDSLAQAPDQDDLFLPRSQLTQPPHALAEVQIDYPEGTPIGRFRAVLLLFIDETGKVRRIRVRDTGLPAGLEAAALAAFYAAGFTPGELEGRRVKSLYPVEVSFTAEPTVRNTGTP
jgi:hypothetical protein